jgi:hypothetical protein
MWLLSPSDIVVTQIFEVGKTSKVMHGPTTSRRAEASHVHSDPDLGHVCTHDRYLYRRLFPTTLTRFGTPLGTGLPRHA